MITTKAKILAALEIALEDIAEDRLLDILLDAYAAKKRAIEHLSHVNDTEREKLREERQAVHMDRMRMHKDPLYCAAGSYYFRLGGTDYYIVHVQGTKIILQRCQANYDQLAQPISREEFYRT
jgi:hypothetical protein